MFKLYPSDIVLALSVFGVVVLGCSVAQRKIEYDNGPVVNIVPKNLIIEHCYQEGNLHDDGSIATKDNTAACYEREKKIIWVQPTRVLDVIHEFCHYFCDKSNDIDACDKRCNRINESNPYFTPPTQRLHYNITEGRSYVL